MEEGGNNHPWLENYNDRKRTEWIPSGFQNYDGDWVKLIPTCVLTTLQWLLCLGAGIYFVSHSEISQFMWNTVPGTIIHIIMGILYVIVLVPFLQTENFDTSCLCTRFVIWSILTAFLIGLVCTFSDNKEVVLEALILTSATGIFITLSILFFGCVLGRCFRTDLSVILARLGIFFAICLYVFIQIFHPFADVWPSVFACAAPIAFCLAFPLEDEHILITTVQKHFFVSILGLTIAVLGNLDVFDLFKD